MTDPNGAPHTDGLSAVHQLPITFHSPSAIVGTPLDPTSRFEYPFPPDPDPSPEFTPSKNATLISFIPRPEDSRMKSPLHPKHVVQEPPMPPSLMKKSRHFDLQIPSNRRPLGKSVRKGKPEGDENNSVNE